MHDLACFPSRCGQSQSGTGFLCIENPDRAAATVKRLTSEAGIDPREMTTCSMTRPGQVSPLDTLAGQTSHSRK
jgi:hypothetical protein